MPRAFSWRPIPRGPRDSRSTRRLAPRAKSAVARSKLDFPAEVSFQISELIRLAADGRKLRRTGGREVRSWTNRSSWLAGSVVSHLGAFGGVKHPGSATKSSQQRCEHRGKNTALPAAKSILPQAIAATHSHSDTLVARQGRTPARSGPFACAAYVSLFPQFITGPIERANQFLPQIRRGRATLRVAPAIGTQSALTRHFGKFQMQPRRHRSAIGPTYRRRGTATQLSGSPSLVLRARPTKNLLAAL